MGLQDFDVVDEFLGCLEAQGWPSAFANPRPKVVMTLIAKFYQSMNQKSLTCVQILVGDINSDSQSMILLNS